MNTTDFLNIATAICPDKTAIVFEGQRYTFSQLNERVNRLANGLLKLGVKAGDRVAFLQVNCNQCVETYFAVAKMGGIYLPLNFRTKEKELAYMLNTADCETIIAGDRYIPIIKGIQPEVACLKNIITIETKQEGLLHYDEIIASSPADEVVAEIGDDDTTILMYTAGTTGFPRGSCSRTTASAATCWRTSPPPPRRLARATSSPCRSTMSPASRP